MEKTRETARLRLRPLVASDLAAYQRLLALPPMAAANGSPADASPELMARWFEADRQSPFAFAVVDRTTDRFMGTILYYQHDESGETPHEYDLGYFLDPMDWGQGLMPEALRASLTLVGQAAPAAQTVWAACLPTNQRSQRVLEKLGFQLVATALPTPQHPALFKLVVNGEKKNAATDD